MIKIIQKPEEHKEDSLKLKVGDTLCCWDSDDDVKAYLMVTHLSSYTYPETPYTIICLNETDYQNKATNENDELAEYFYSNLDNLARDVLNNYDHVKKIDLVATAEEHSDDED